MADKVRTFAERGAAGAREAIEKSKTVAEDAARGFEQSSQASLETIREWNVKLIEMAHANAEAGFDFARQMATAKAPSDIAELWTAHARKQFEMLTEQVKELTTLSRKIASSSAEPLSRSVTKAS